MAVVLVTGGSSGIGLETAGDPDEAARAIAECIRTDEPPARIMVEADGIGMEKTIRQASAEDLASMMRDFVASLTRG